MYYLNLSKIFWLGILNIVIKTSAKICFPTYYCKESQDNHEGNIISDIYEPYHWHKKRNYAHYNDV